MSQSLIDIYNNVLEFNGEEISIIIDNKNIPWFSAINVASILEYVDTKRAIINNVDTNDKTTFANLKKYIKNIPKNSQPHAVYINESGLYSLVLSSNKPLAKEFKRWVTEKVLPSIRQTGSYTTEEKYKKQLQKLNAKISQVL